MVKLLNIQEIQASKWPKILQETFGENLISAFLHGNCLMEGFDALHFPWTISFILKNNSTEEIAAIQKLTKQAQKENIQFTYFFSPIEIIKNLDAFPLEFLHIANKNVTLCGIQPLAGFFPQKDNLCTQCERELRGTLIQLRQSFVNTPEKNMKKLYKSVLEETLPILYGVYYLKTGIYPEKHQDVFDVFPSLLGENFIEALEELTKAIPSFTTA